MLLNEGMFVQFAQRLKVIKEGLAANYIAFTMTWRCRDARIIVVRWRTSREGTADLLRPHRTGVCKASQVVDVYPSTSPEIDVRDVQLWDCWEVADTHCSSFFPRYKFPLDLLLRINRFIGLLSAFSVPSGCMRICLVAVTGFSVNDENYYGNENSKDGFYEGNFRFNQGSVAGILTVDTVADFLPRKGQQKLRRTGIAYISNVAVREEHRRKGIAKRLVTMAEMRACSWGCRAITLHCDGNDLAAMNLYKGQGFKCIKVPNGANWPQPKASPGTQFSFMMKLLNFDSCEDR